MIKWPLKAKKNGHKGAKKKEQKGRRKKNNNFNGGGRVKGRACGRK